MPITRAGVVEAGHPSLRGPHRVGGALRPPVGRGGVGAGPGLRHGPALAAGHGAGAVGPRGPNAVHGGLALGPNGKEDKDQDPHR